MSIFDGRKTPKKNQEPDHSSIFNVLALTLAAVAILTLLAVVILRYKNPTADVGTLLNAHHTALGYIAGIITGRLGLNDRQNRG